jgi:iron complex outermembrane receptor protein
MALEGSNRLEALLHRSLFSALLCLSAGGTALGARASWAGNADEALEPELAEIVVTARKRPQPIDDVPIAIDAVTAPTLAATATRDLFDLAGLVPGMVFSRAPDDGLALTLRGVGTPARSQAFDQSIALFLDGTFLAKGKLYPLALFDTERVEVLRGPHSTEVGKNASVGALSVVSREPGESNAVNAAASWDAQRGGYVLEAGTDVQLGTDSALRVAGTQLDRHGWVQNDATGHEVPEDKDTGVRMTLRTRPLPGLSGVLRFQYSDYDRLGTAMQLVGPPGSGGPGAGDTTLDDRSFAFTPRGPGGESHHATLAHLASAHFDLDSRGLTWVSETAWVDYRASTLDDLDFSASSDVDFQRAETFHQISQELRVASAAGGRIEYLAGAFFLRSRWHSLETEYWNVPGFPPGLPIAGQLFNGPFTNDFLQNTQSEALFANGTWRANQRWSLFAGLRLTGERKDVVYGRFNSAPLTLWNTVINPPFALTPLEFDGHFLDGNLAAQFELGRAAMAYASFGRGNKLGGFVETNGVPNADPAQDARIGSETTNAWELGARYHALGDRLRLNLTLFDMEIANFQDTTFNGTAFVTTNLPARSRGIEFESSWISPLGIEARFAATWADATELIGGQTFQLTQAPRWTGVASIGYSHQLAARLRTSIGADLRYRDAMFNQRGELFPSSAFAPLGLRMAVEDATGAWGVALIGRNVTNQVSAEFAGPTPDPLQPPSASPAALRSILLTAWIRR